jgi:Na+-translocating ferredoxin:NAD+ oxidoreductase subunit B
VNTVRFVLRMVNAPEEKDVPNINSEIMTEGKNKYQSRRDFVKNAGKFAVVLPLAVIPVVLSRKISVSGYVWQIDPYKCTQCGQCKTNCVLTPSASKCVHAYQMCGFCDLCGGYLRQGVKTISTGAENQLCPTGAITRKFVEEPYFEYTINENICDGCAKCVKGCGDFGNGSLYMQIRHNLCVNCNDCSIARTCPSDAVIRVPATAPYLPKDKGKIRNKES